MAMYKAKLQARSGADLDRAVVRFAAGWKRRRNKTIARKLVARLRKEAAKSRIAIKRANAKARESVRRAELLAKTRARKAAVKARAKLRKLMAKARSRARMAGKRAVKGKVVQGKAVGRKTSKACLAAVSAKKVARHNRSI
jgi:histone H1/5